MKTTVKVASLMLILALMIPAYIQAAELPEVVANHEQAAASYKEKALAQDALIAEHQQMKEDYERRYYINEKVTPKKGIRRKMEKHCDAIVKAAQQEKQELLGFARWHEMRAAELEGR